MIWVIIVNLAILLILVMLVDLVNVVILVKRRVTASMRHMPSGTCYICSYTLKLLKCEDSAVRFLDSEFTIP